MTEHTHIEAVRYPEGSDTMGLLALTILTGGRPGRGRVALWLKNLRRFFAAASLQDLRCLLPVSLGAGDA